MDSLDIKKSRKPWQMSTPNIYGVIYENSKMLKQLWNISKSLLNIFGNNNNYQKYSMLHWHGPQQRY